MLHLFAGLDLHTGLLLLLALAFVLFYEAINGFHDTANAVATVIYTRAMRSQLAVVMAAVFNFFGVLLGVSAWRMPLCICYRRISCSTWVPRTASLWSFPCCWRRLSGTSVPGISGCRRQFPHADWRHYRHRFNQCDDDRHVSGGCA